MSYDFNIIFQFRYYLESLNSYYINNFNYITIFILILLGFLSGINPCLLSLLPIYNAYLNQKNKKEYNFFIGGMYSGIIVLVSLSATIYKAKLYTQYGSLLIGLIIILLGSQKLKITNFNNSFFSLQRFLKYVKIYQNNILESYLLGVVLGLMGASCSTPSIVTISLWLQNTNQLYLGGLFISIYSASYILPIILLNSIFNKISSNIEKFVFGEWFRIIGGNMLITIGMYYILFFFD